MQAIFMKFVTRNAAYDFVLINYEYGTPNIFRNSPLYLESLQITKFAIAFTLPQIS